MNDITYISKVGLASELQIPEPTISNWMSRHWLRGDHYIVIGRTTLINVIRVKEWLDDFSDANKEQKKHIEDH